MQPNTSNLNVSRWPIKDDFLASIVTFLVALPLCMGIAIASGLPVSAGLITGIVGGIVVGALAGCPLQVSGPAAGLTVIILEIVQHYGLEILGVVVLCGGILQMAAGILRLGQWFRAVSPAVIHGMLAGIGVLIVGSQFHVMIDDKPKGSGLQNLVSIPEAAWKSLSLPNLRTPEIRQHRIAALQTAGELQREQFHVQELMIEHLPHHAKAEPGAGVHQEFDPVSADLTFLTEPQAKITREMQALAERLSESEKSIENGDHSEQIREAALAAAARAQAALDALQTADSTRALETQAAAVAAFDTLQASLKNHSLAAEIGILTIILIVLWQTFAPRQLKVVPAPLIAIIVATTVAAVIALPVLYVQVPDKLWEDIRFPTLASLDDAPWHTILQLSIMIAVVASAETLLCATAVDQLHSGKRTNYDRELFSQGVGNAICGLLGALPMTGVIVRSSANVQAGAKTRASAMLHGVWLIVFVAFLGFILRMIPTASLAAILVYTGYKLVNLKAVRELLKYGWGEVAIYAVTVFMIVATDLLTGVIVGICLAAAKLLYAFSQLTAELNVDSATNSGRLILNGAATFIRLPKLASTLEKVPRGCELTVDLHRLEHIDHACLDLLTTWSRQHEVTGGKTIIDWDSLHSCYNGRNGHSPTLAQDPLALGDRRVVVEPRSRVPVGNGEPHH